MPDDHVPASDPEELTPREREVRRLLAEARHDDPVPDDVVARLDRVLARLAEEPARTAPVADLAARRRRAAGLLVAAAAVLVVGVGLGQVVGPLGGFSGDVQEAGAPREVADEGAAGASGASDAESGATAAQDDAPQESAPQAAEADGKGAQGRAKVTSVSVDSFSDDVLALQDLVPVSDAPAHLVRGYSRDRAAARACRAPSWGSGSFVPVHYDGVPGVVVFRRASGDTQVADLFLCGSTEPVRSTTLPAP